METINLKNGLNVVVNQMSNTHSFTIGLYIKTGTRYERFKENGITHLLEHIHFRELSGLPQDKLYYKMESIGSTLKGATYQDFIKFTMKACPQYFGKCIDIFKDILTTYDWSIESFKQEKEIVLKQIDEYYYNFSIQNDIKKSLLGNCNLTYDIVGNKKSIKQLTLSDVIAYKRKHFNSNNILLCITGCVSEEDIILLKREFETIALEFGEKNSPNHNLPMLYHREPNIVLYNDNWNYIDVNITFDINYQIVSLNELKILNCILGEGVGSRLQMQIREKLRLTSNIVSEIEAYEDFAFLHIKYSIDKENFIECLLNVISVLEALKTNICFDDLAVSIPFYLDNQVFLQDDTEQMNFEIAYNSFILGNDCNEMTINYDASSIERLSIIAKQVFIPQNLSVIVFGNYDDEIRANIESTIEKLSDDH